jgi:hypothetical protein
MKITPALVRRPDIGLLPLSSVQESMIDVYKTSPTPDLHIMEVFRSGMDIDQSVIERAMCAVMSRHTLLRSRIVSDEQGRHRAVVDDAMTPWVEELSPTGLPSDAASPPTAASLISRFFFKPFDLGTGPLLRMGVIRSNGNRGVGLALVAHHVVMDGWSIPILLHELMVFHEAILSGLPPRLPDLPVQFSDFIAFQNEWIASAEGQKQIEYWRRRMSGANRPFWLPADRKRPAESGSRTTAITGRIESATTISLRKVARSAGSTLPSLFLAAFAVTLYRWSGNTDVLTWVCHFGRSRTEVLGLIGCFIDSWVLRVKLTEEIRFTDALKLVHGASVEALPTLDLPGRYIVDELAASTGRDDFRGTFFNYVVKPQRSTGDAGSSQISGIEVVQSNPYIDPADQLQFSIGAFESGDTVTWTLGFDPSVFEDETIVRVSELLCQTLQQVAEHPELSLSQLPALETREPA